MSKAKTPRTRKRKSELIPKYGTPERNVAVTVFKLLPTYKKNLEKGFPFFSAEELDEIKEKYKEGITWDEIDAELIRKGLIIKKATFRKYIQNRLLPAAIGYKKTNKGRVAVYPSDTIEHINFIQYYFRVESDNFLDLLFGKVETDKISLAEALTEYDSWLDPPYAEMVRWITGMGGGNLEEALQKLLKDSPEKLNKCISTLDGLTDKFDAEIRPELDKLNKWLETETIPRKNLLKIKKEV